LLGEQPAVGDGAIGTALQAAGLPLGRGPEAWCLVRPEAVRAVHAAYAAAGAAWATANSFGALPAEAAAAVRLAREGAPGLPVFGSVGPAVAPEPLAVALAAAGAEVALVETITTLAGGLEAVRAAGRAGFHLVIATVTPGREGNLLDGTRLETAAEALTGAGAALVGLNCGAGPADMLPAARRLAAAGVAPVYVAPNAGLPEVEGGGARYALKPACFADAAIRFVEAGACLVAGCCGVGPAHIAAARARVRGE